MKVDIDESLIDLLEELTSKLKGQRYAEEVAKIEPPEGYILKEESKSKRLQLLVKPSTLDRLKSLSEETGKSVNAIANKILEKCLNEIEGR